MSWPRYRLRTWLRKRLPYVLSDRLPTGAHDCGEHDWYNADDVVERCYHCRVGVRPRSSQPIADDPTV